MNCVTRRGFIAAGGMLGLSTAMGAGVPESKDLPALATGSLIVSSPVLQNAAETSMCVAFAVSDLANAFVCLSESADMSNARVFTCGGYRVTDIDNLFARVRLTGLKPATKYYYTIGADRIAYKHGYDMKIVGREEDRKIRSFTTLGEGGASHFCVINDTHASARVFALAVGKVSELKPACLIWNGDTFDQMEKPEGLRDVFFPSNPETKDYASGLPILFVPGNHDVRGFAARHLERAFMFRQPEERSSRDWDLGRNFAVRCGDVALIGLDTGEDKPDETKVFAGLFNMENYRVAQAAWLAEALERPDIKSAPHIVAFCHIPLWDPKDRMPKGCEYLFWQPTARKLWGPILQSHGVKLVVTAHMHRYRHDRATASRPWDQIVGGGPELGGSRDSGGWHADPSLFPTVIDGRVLNGRLEVSVYDVLNNRLVESFSYAPNN